MKTDTDAQLDAIEALAELERQTRTSLSTAVEHAIKAGCTWAEVAHAAGVSKQVAHKKWSAKGRKSNADYQRNLRADARGQFRLGEAGRSTKGDKKPRHP